MTIVHQMQYEMNDCQKIFNFKHLTFLFIQVGIITTFAILVHEIPHEVGDFAILLRSGFDRWKAAKAQILTASGGLLGTITALSADSIEEAGMKTAWILPFTSGGFIYIALVSIVPELVEETEPKQSVKQIICIIAGIACMLLVTLIFE
ncbi:zinc transporter ZIP13 [Octopus bimaculoides]|nr:zinc transporter ZIP13 [Octopus bimaculoides]